MREVLSLFAPEPGTTYLNTATYGLPPSTTVATLEQAARAWQGGTADWIADWDRQAESCRAHVARLFGLGHQAVGEREIALMPSASVASGIVATAVPDGGEVLLADEDFTSVTFPFAAAAERGRIRVRSAPLDHLADAVGPGTSLVAVSVAQSADGRLADLPAIRQALDRYQALGRHQGLGQEDGSSPSGPGRLYVDASQALGNLPLDLRALGVDYASCAAYKWLCCPRGVAFLYVRRASWSEPLSVAANWRGGDDPYGRYYGTELALADDAARFDVSLAWHAWAGARSSLDALCRLDDRTRFELGHAAARRFAERLSLPTPAAGIVSVPVDERSGPVASSPVGGAPVASSPVDGAPVASSPVDSAPVDGLAADLDRRRIRAASRAGLARFSFHFYNTVEEAEQAADAVRPYLRTGR